MGKAYGQSFVVQELVVVGACNTIHLSQHETLERGKVMLKYDRAKCSLPLALEARRALLVPLYAN